jgi:hypothetical protein
MGRHEGRKIAAAQCRNDQPRMAEGCAGAFRSPLRVRMVRRVSRWALVVGCLLGISPAILTSDVPNPVPPLCAQVFQMPQEIRCARADLRYGHRKSSPFIYWNEEYTEYV